MADLRRWALEELGLGGPGLSARLESLKGEKDPVATLKEEVRRLGRRLLGKYHPDRPEGSVEKFHALNEVLRTLSDLKLTAPEPEPRVRVSVSYYPEASPYGGSVQTRTTRKSYFDFKTEHTASSGVRYDPRRVVRMRPGRKK